MSGWQFEAGHLPIFEFAGDQIQVPRLGAHLRVWGSGHSCSSYEPDLPPHRCVCQCGVPAPQDLPL